MKYRYAFLIFLGAFLIQGNLLNLIAVLGVTPDLILCLVVVFSLFYDRQLHAPVFGALFGVLSDVCHMQYAGVSSLGYLAISLCVFLAGRVVNRENLATVLILTALSAISFAFYEWIVYLCLGSGIDFSYAMRYMTVGAVYDTAVAALLYRLLINRVVRFRGDRHYRSAAIAKRIK